LRVDDFGYDESQISLCPSIEISLPSLCKPLNHTVVATTSHLHPSFLLQDIDFTISWGDDVWLLSILSFTFKPLQGYLSRRCATTNVLYLCLWFSLCFLWLGQISWRELVILYLFMFFPSHGSVCLVSIHLGLLHLWRDYLWVR
jgi:hypothetical protein